MQMGCLRSSVAFLMVVGGTFMKEFAIAQSNRVTIMIAVVKRACRIVAVHLDGFRILVEALGAMYRFDRCTGGSKPKLFTGEEFCERYPDAGSHSAFFSPDGDRVAYIAHVKEPARLRKPACPGGWLSAALRADF